MIGIPHKDVSANALRLHLYAGQVDWPGLTVFSRGTAICGDLAIDASVIGSSHALVIRNGSLVLTELLACEAPASAEPLVRWQPGDSAIEYAGGDRIRYRFDASVVSLGQAAPELDHLRGLVDHAHLAASEIGLAHRFPSGSEGPWAAETLVWAAASSNGVVSRTAHAYPSEGLLALSRTTIRLPAVQQHGRSTGLAVSI